MPPKKKQKTETSGNGTTLLAFFSNQAANGSSSKLARSSSKSTATVKAGSRKQLLADEDVIVISDDDEPEKPAILVDTNKPKKSATPQLPYPLECEYGVAGPSKLPAWAATRESPGTAPLVDSPAPMMKRELGSSSSSFLDIEESFATRPSSSKSSVMDTDPPDPPRGGTPPPLIPDTPSNRPTSIIADQDVIDVDALDDDHVWRNDDDEFQADEFQADETEDAAEDVDEDEPRADVKGKGKCLGEIVLDDAESNAACPICEVSTRGWSQEAITTHVNSCLDQARSKSAPAIKPLAPLTSFKRHHTPKPPNAFSLLMSSRKENEAWKQAEVDLAKPDSAVGKARRSEGRRKAPFYKVMTGMPIAVDAFRYGKIPGVKAYLLTHAHSDHYTNLSSNWKNGPIYCSHTTANLIKLMLKVDPKWVKPLPFDTPTILPETGGVEVTLLEANHCPGSCLFLFKGPQTINAGDSDFSSPYVGSKKIFRYLHCGDFRASPRHVLHPTIKGQKLDIVYLDTTYLNAKYCFPPQKLVIEACADLAVKLVNREGSSSNGETSQPSVGKWFSKTSVKEEVAVKDEVEDDYDAGAMLDDDPEGDLGFPMDEKPDLRLLDDHKGKRDIKVDLLPSGKNRPLVVIGTYSIGKERIVKAVAKALSSKVYCDARKRGILLCQDDPELHAMMTDDPYEGQVHLVPLQTINLEKIEPYFTRFRSKFSSVIGFRPTGWTYSAPAGTDLLPNIPQVISRSQSRNFTSSSLNPMRNSSAQYKLYGVPYSEHSSFFELTCFALSVDVVKIIATVNVGSAKSRGMMGKWFEKWEAERKKRRKEGADRIVPYRNLDYW